MNLYYQFPEGKAVYYIPQQVSDNLAGLESTGKDTIYEAPCPGNVDLKEVNLQEIPPTLKKSSICHTEYTKPDCTTCDL